MKGNVGYKKKDIRYAPSRRKVLKLANALFRLLDRFDGRILALDEEKLIRKARKKTGLYDFGDDAFREPLQLLCENSRTGRPMTAVGRIALQEDILRRLKNKLRIEAFLKAHPKVLEQEVRTPIFITGAPRTGTSLLQRLLAADPASRSLRSWEMADPVPPPSPETFTTNPRFKKDKLRWAFLNYAAPNLITIHEAGPDIPEECISLMANNFTSMWFLASMEAYEYFHWLQKLDLTENYRFHKRQLQLLQWNFPENIRWVLKSPWHANGLEWLMQVYPDVRIVQTHRDMSEVLPSYFSLMLATLGIFYEELDHMAVADKWTEIIACNMEKGLAARKKKEEQGGSPPIFLDVLYTDLVADPIGTIEKLYEKSGFELSGEAVDRMRRYLEENPQHKHGKHRYSLEQFGLTAVGVQERFRSYHEQFLGI